MRGMWGGGPDEDDPVRVLREEKRELSNATAEEVFRILTPDQQAEAPKPEADSGRQRWQQMQQGGQQRGGGRGQRDRGSDV
ncbi:MAG: hypothetical protein HND57_13745 [Planctomycetes bacterium]|nr:hypothetical protein [Planctomycetota bacterium]